MQTISLPYGRDRVEAQIPDQRLAAVLRSGAQSYRPQADQAQLVRQALENPIGTPPLRELAKGKHQEIRHQIEKRELQHGDKHGEQHGRKMSG